MKMTNTTLSNRLKTASELVRGGYVADIGTDHAMLPIYLVQSGIAKKALASDINAQPLKKAKLNIEIHGLSDRIDTVLTNGLSGIEDYPFTDIIMAGLGGLNIIDILNRAPSVKANKVHLILQPMQHIPELRHYLYANGFSVDEERFASDEDKIYQIISATYSGIVESSTKLEDILGKYSLAHKDQTPELFDLFCDKFIYYLTDRITGLKKGNLDAGDDEELLKQIESEKIS